ncbi:MAG: NAD(P)H-dependent oxidoreductase subunit E [Planctomycetes bacterium]|nr:NAD(P)H-dependent oxidoreductase subunit E [Planctomycetota bacterium]
MARTLEGILEARRGKPHLVIEALQDVQAEYGYIPEEAVRGVSDALEVPLIEVYRVANFYKAFSLEPRGRHLITICMGTACHVRRSPLLLDEVIGQLGVEPGGTTEDRCFTVECVNCLGACALGPVVVLDGEVHHHMTPAKLRRLVASVRASDAKGGARCRS